MKVFLKMSGKHITAFASAFCHDELPTTISRTVGEHLMACSSCHADFDEVKLGAKFAGQLEPVTAPETIWAAIEARLDQHSSGTNAFPLRRSLAIAAAVVLVIGAAFLLIRSRTNRPPLTSWQVARLNGTPRIGSIGFNDRANLGIGEWLETDENARAQLDVATIGRIEVEPNSRVRLIETKPTEHRLELQRGGLSARISAPPKLFFVETPSGVAEDLGCAYTLEVDDNGNSLLHVTSGWVAMQLADRETKVPAGAACSTRRGIGVGTPYFEDATPAFRGALAKFDFDDVESKHAAVGVLIQDARPRDALTLWYLLSRVPESERGRVYDCMAGLITPPKAVTRAGVIQLNPAMLDQWRLLIEENHSPARGKAVRDFMGRARSAIARRIG